MTEIPPLAYEYLTPRSFFPFFQDVSDLLSEDERALMEQRMKRAAAR